jgi:hypothetical protein
MSEKRTEEKKKKRRKRRRRREVFVLSFTYLICNAF